MFHPKTYQTPNAIDAGEAPPTRPARRTDSGDSSSLPSVEDVRLNAERVLSLVPDRPSAPRPAIIAKPSVSFRLARDRRLRDGFVDDDSSDAAALLNGTRATVTASVSTDPLSHSPSHSHSFTRPRQRQNHYDDDNGGGDDLAYVYDADDRTGEEEGKYQYDYPPIANGHGSLPSVQEAQLYAGRIHRSIRDTSPESAERASWSSLPLHNDKPDAAAVHSSSRTVSLMTSTQQQDKRRRRMRLCLWSFLVLAILSFFIAAVVLLAKQQQQQSSSQGQSAYTSSTSTTPPTSTTTTNILGGASPRLLETLDFLTKRSISSRAALDDWSTPQYDAAVWIADHDTLAYSIPTSNQNSGDQSYMDFVQRYVLAVFYYALNGPTWQEQNLFLDTEHVCGWYTRLNLDDGEVVAVGVTCNNDGEVAELLLPRNTMDGTLPTELALLTKLDFIDLNRNTIHGSIPNEFSALTSMTFVDLRYNELTGSIPDWVGSAWTNLGELSLSTNFMTGSLPTTMSNLQQLKTLSLAHNQFDSTLAPIASLANLEYVYLENNGFQGIINDDFLKDMPKLVQVDVSTNSLSAQNLPLHLLQHDTLQVLDLSDNIIMGTLPSDILDNTALQYLSLSDNSITGTLPARINALQALTHLDVTGNGLTGQIPESLSTMQSLTYLFVSENGFSKGPIPDFFGGMSNLRELSLSSTQRNGTLPSDWLGGFKNLVLFDVSYNEMTGTIPANIWNHKKLEYLLLNRNNFSGSIPSGITSTKLNLLLLDKNSLTGDLTDACNLKVDFIVADCDEITCTCCTCCSDSEPGCNDDLLYTNLDFSWEKNYTRVSYAFSPSILFEQTHQLSGLN